MNAASGACGLRNSARPFASWTSACSRWLLAAAGFPPDVEGSIRDRAGRERTFEFAQARHQFVVSGGEEIIEGGGRRRAEIERQLALHGQSVPSGVS